MRKGKLIIVSGPSGVGKGTILKNIKFDNYILSISSTTRDKREGEINGVHYNFLSNEEFEKRIEDGKMLEYAKFVGNYYGTDKELVLNELDKGNNVLLEIEAQGAFQLLGTMEDIISIFIIPPSIDELEHRLVTRGTETRDKIDKRIQKAKEEILLKDKYKYVVINDDLESATKELDEIFIKEGLK